MPIPGRKPYADQVPDLTRLEHLIDHLEAAERLARQVNRPLLVYLIGVALLEARQQRGLLLPQ